MVDQSEEDIIDEVFVYLKEQVPKRTIDKVLRAYATLRVAEAIANAKPRPDDL